MFPYIYLAQNILEVNGLIAPSLPNWPAFVLSSDAGYNIRVGNVVPKAAGSTEDGSAGIRVLRYSLYASKLNHPFSAAHFCTRIACSLLEEAAHPTLFMACP